MKKIVLKPVIGTLLKGLLGAVLSMVVGLALLWHVGSFGAAPAEVKIGFAIVCGVLYFGFLATHLTPDGTGFELFGKRRE